MSRIQPAPIKDSLTTEDGDISFTWVTFFNQLYNGDTGTAWTPTFTNLTVVGTPTITGTLYRIGQSLAYFSIKIIPATTTASTAASTYCNNFPVSVKTPGPCFALGGNTGTISGMVENSSSRIYTPAWAATGLTLWIVGMCEIQ